jgi:hypothetical protein
VGVVIELNFVTSTGIMAAVGVEDGLSLMRKIVLNETLGQRRVFSSCRQSHFFPYNHLQP